jgi:hypothetical protein
MSKLKYIVAVVLVFMVSFVGGCCGADATTAEANEQEIIYAINGEAYRNGVHVDSRTGVNYLITHTGVCVMVDAEGKPLVDKGE